VTRHSMQIEALNADQPTAWSGLWVTAGPVMQGVRDESHPNNSFGTHMCSFVISPLQGVQVAHRTTGAGMLIMIITACFC